MNQERPIARPGSPSGAPPAPHVEPGCYLAPTPVPEVLFDQLEYLLSHAGRHCPQDCVDCLRLQQVRIWLLLPFDSGLHGPAQ